MKPVYLKNNSNFIKTKNKILIKENFISENEYQGLMNAAEDLLDEDWNTHPTNTDENGKISINLKETLSVSNNVLDLIVPKYWINEHKTVNRMRPSDIPNEFGWDEWTAADYLLVYYFGNFKGGNLKCYNIESPEDFTILKIKKNTVYLLPIANKERYISESVEDGIKYSFVDWIYRHAEWAIP